MSPDSSGVHLGNVADDARELGDLDHLLQELQLRTSP